MPLQCISLLRQASACRMAYIILFSFFSPFVHSFICSFGDFVCFSRALVRFFLYIFDLDLAISVYQMVIESWLLRVSCHGNWWLIIKVHPVAKCKVNGLRLQTHIWIALNKWLIIILSLFAFFYSFIARAQNTMHLVRKQRKSATVMNRKRHEQCYQWHICWIQNMA